jgi:hypothetical protein
MTIATPGALLDQLLAVASGLRAEGRDARAESVDAAGTRQVALSIHMPAHDDWIELAYQVEGDRIVDAWIGWAGGDTIAEIGDADDVLAEGLRQLRFMVAALSEEGGLFDPGDAEGIGRGAAT